MVQKDSLVLLTSTSYRHKYIANELNKSFNLEYVFVEEKSSKIESDLGLSIEDSKFLKNHFFEREKNEIKHFGRSEGFNNNFKLIKVNHGQINSDYVFDQLKSINPKRIILFGTSIIKSPIIDFFSGKIINLHLGLSPYYKGSATNLFPIKYKELECIGATIHIATSKVDEGPILHQLRPDLELNDSLHDIGNKVILRAGKILPIIIQKHIEGKIIGLQQQYEGRLCKIKDLNILVLKEIYDTFEKGLLKVLNVG
jgi:folate-dependent phosphoribosylglycinamide formyltransferase PurN